MAVPKVTASEVIEALKKHQGLAALAADSLGVHVQTIYNYRDKYPTVADTIKHLREKRKDVVEGKLWSRINSDDTTAIIFFLKTQAKDRGYVERQEITGAEEDNREIKIRNVEYRAGVASAAE
jgi:hypothetical protein